MVSKNNKAKRQQWSANQRPHYSLRKLSIGVASVLLGTTLYLGGTAHAATTPTTNSTTTASMATTNSVAQSAQQPNTVKDESTTPRQATQSTSGTETTVPSTQATQAQQPSSAAVTNVQIKMATTNQNDPQTLKYSELHGETPLTVNVSGEISPTAKAGDTFSIQYSNNLKANDAEWAHEETVSSLNDAQGNQIAYGYIVTDQHKIVYVLTPNVEGQTGLKFNTTNYFFPQIETVKNSGTIDAVITVGDVTKRLAVNVQYDNLVNNENTPLAANVRMYDINFTNGKYKINLYTNVQNKSLDNQQLRLSLGNKENTNLDPHVSKYTIYRVKDGKTLSESLVPNYDEYDNITDQFKLTTNQDDANKPGFLYYTPAGDSAIINLGGANDTNSYIIHIEGQAPIVDGKITPGVGMQVLPKGSLINFGMGSMSAGASASGETPDQLAVARFVGDRTVDSSTKMPTSLVSEGFSNKPISFADLNTTIKQLKKKHLVVKSLVNNTTGQVLVHGSDLTNHDWQNSFGNYDADKYNMQPFTFIVGKEQLSIKITGTSSVEYGSDQWKNLIQSSSPVTTNGYQVILPNDEQVMLTPRDLTCQQKPGNVGTYQVVLTAAGLQDIKDQLGDDYDYPDLEDVTSDATLIVTPGQTDIFLNGGAEKPYDGTDKLPNTFNTAFGLGNNDTNSITVYQADGTPVRVTLKKGDIALKDGSQPINVGNYGVILTDQFKNRLKAADGNNGKNYNWNFDLDQQTAIYNIYADDSIAKLSGINGRTYNGTAVTTTEVTKDGKIAVHVTAPVYIQGAEPGDETLEKTLDFGDYTLQDGDYTWGTSDGNAPIDGGTYTINLNGDQIIPHLQEFLNKKAGIGQDNQPNVTIDADGLSGTATYQINTTVTYQFVDHDNNDQPIGQPVIMTGQNGDTQDISLTIPDNYELVSGTLPTETTFGPTNQVILIKLKRSHSSTPTPGQPSTPKPIVPQPGHVSSPKPTTSNKNQLRQNSATEVLPVSHPRVNTSSRGQQLPQTGNQQNVTAIGGLLIAGLTTLLGFADSKKKKQSH